MTKKARGIPHSKVIAGYLKNPEFIRHYEARLARHAARANKAEQGPRVGPLLNLLRFLEATEAELSVLSEDLGNSEIDHVIFGKAYAIIAITDRMVDTLYGELTNLGVDFDKTLEEQGLT